MDKPVWNLLKWNKFFLHFRDVNLKSFEVIFLGSNIMAANDNVVVRTRCKAHNANGRRCKNITLKTDMCWVHLQKEEHLRIKKSGLPGAGFGVYTTVPRREGDKLGEYKGKRVFHPIDGPYVLQIAANEFVNANRSTDGPMRYANMARRGDQIDGRPARNNANFKVNWRLRVPIVKASKNIPAGKEILANYGRDYWN
ncbi:MAG: SET domain-containing protein [Candidatus Pacebacteria bacterium]|nr:SET domain-containing protein [Candidatus Paceibacterota bacterium]